MGFYFETPNLVLPQTLLPLCPAPTPPSPPRKERSPWNPRHWPLHVPKCRKKGREYMDFQSLASLPSDKQAEETEWNGGENKSRWEGEERERH